MTIGTARRAAQPAGRIGEARSAGNQGAGADYAFG
jgi:hypothetical protein